MRRRLVLGGACVVLMLGGAPAVSYGVGHRRAAQPTPQHVSSVDASGDASDDDGDASVDASADAAGDAHVDSLGGVLCRKLDDEIAGIVSKARKNASAWSDEVRRSQDFESLESGPEHPCVHTDTSAWTIEPIQLRGRFDDERLSGSRAELTLVYLTDSKRLTWHLPAQATLMGSFSSENKEDNCCEKYSYLPWPAIQIASDYDGDGEPEILLSNYWTHEGSEETYDALISARDGAIDVLRELPKEAKLQDIDADGRKDIVFALEGTGTSCPSGFPTHQIALDLALHARRDGEFSPDDEVARAFVRKECPSRADATADSLRGIACARLWGVSDDKISRQVDRTCPSSNCMKDDGTYDPPACGDRDERIEISSWKPPFLLGKR